MAKAKNSATLATLVNGTRAGEIDPKVLALAIALQIPAGEKHPLKSPALLEHVLDRMAGGEALRRICHSLGFPDATIVWRWLREDDAIEQRYHAATTKRGEVYAEEIVEKSDDLNIPADHKRIMVDARKWVAARMYPKKYGDKVEIEHRGSVDLMGELARREAKAGMA